jgi:ankyrin repeat protein
MPWTNLAGKCRIEYTVILTNPWLTIQPLYRNAAMWASRRVADLDYANRHLAFQERTILEKIASSWGELDGGDLDSNGSAESTLAQATPTNAHLNRLDQFGRAPLHVAVQRGDVDTLAALLKAGAEPNVTDWTGETPLFFAVRQGKVKCAELLLEAGADANFTNAYGRTPITYAFSSPEVLSLLLNYGANVCIPPDAQGFSDPLSNAVTEFHDWTHRDETAEMWAQSLDLLISAGVDINSGSGFWQRAPLLTALFNQNAPLVELLIDRGAQVTSVDSELDTIFHNAAYCPQVECVQVLRQAKISNVDPNAINIDGDTPMDIINWQASKPNLRPGERRVDQGLIKLFGEMIQEARQRFTESACKGEPDVESDAGEVGAEDNMRSNPNTPASNPTSQEIVTTGQGRRENQEDQYHDTDTEEFFDAQS